MTIVFRAEYGKKFIHVSEVKGLFKLSGSSVLTFRCQTSVNVIEKRKESEDCRLLPVQLLGMQDGGRNIEYEYSDKGDPDEHLGQQDDKGDPDDGHTGGC
ncbi:hypothetical protein KXD40_003422 [Peronospora effusa]|uniref:Uncharacterized protein n=1 Tax=Peronospora effusa TaxID=542832 RepID=A0A3M6VDW1_9STRA|nr:hypothetical protein DD238_005755 [Peronospora effusa]RQM15844.1 hypothetical protein DD237_005871 [Peronospora effusa]UIZ23172.1 hypothetical protein KXD40_003422 [Peronospora effusa]